MKNLLLSVGLLLALPAVAGDRRGMTSPGKPRAPLTVKTDVQGLVAAEREHDIQLTVLAGSRCDAVDTLVYGLHGVEVTTPGAKTHGRVERARSAVHAVRARVAPGAAGELVVIATCRVGALSRDAVHVFPLSAKGRNGELPARASKPMGTVEVDESGRRVHVLRSAK